MWYPKSFQICSGKGFSKYKLVAFDNALLDAGISNYNLLRVSSILPANCRQSEIITLKHGSPLLTAYATASSDNVGAELATAIAVGIPEDRDDIGIIMEYHEEGNANHAQSIAKEMVIEAMTNHKIKIRDILSSSIEGIVEEGQHLSLISAIVLW